MADKHTSGDGLNDLCALLMDRNVCTATKASEEPQDKNLWPRAVARKWMPVLFMGACLVYCARMTMPICAVAMAASFNWNKIDTGVVLGGFFWGYSCTAILGGHASDKIGGERVLLFSATSWAVVTAATPALAHLGSHTLALMTMARVLMGVLQGVFFPSLASLIAQRAPKGQKSFLSSIMQSGTSLGILLAGLLDSIMLDWYSWENAFYAVGFLSGLWALVVWQYLLKGKVYPGQKERRNNFQSKTFSCTHLLSLLRKPCIWSMVFAHMCTCGTSYTLLSWMPTYFSEQYPHVRTWVYNVIPWTAAIPAALCGGYISDSLISQGYSVVFVRKSMQFIAMGVSAAFVMLLSAKMSPPIAVICISAVMVSLSFTSCGSSVNVQDLTPSSAGTLYGFMNMLGAFMGVLMVSLSGYLIEVTDSWVPCFWLVAAVHVVGLTVFLCFGDARRVDLEESNSVALS
ncbi:voltage-gated purine nucleotide uniporter SLC17A9-like isoform X1 [Phyllopteryx taeniolatus]|uniref:voltage-gated purine nucleotide uniporter SLC17A9-like isoform X1 n=1 Tax=Phyllopteryx taeniolatus TaxID=161469 RepID=UPI002AD4E756|nr:voltage-gated purine nucleotide uniporter SLC17A9-like isoform X1 [Phyllopteryx taeniolatus]